MKKQSAVNYREGSELESCGTCSFFEGPESCTQVSGVVSSAGLCDLYLPLEQQTAAPDPAMLEQMLLGGGLPNV